MARKKDAGGAWSYDVGRGTAHVVATERVEAGRSRVVILRYTDPTKLGRDKRAKRALDLKVRDERGKLIPSVVAEAKHAADDLSASLLKGLTIEQRDTEDLTIFQGFTIVADPDTGGHPGKHGATRRARLVASRDTLARIDLLGPGKTFKSLKQADIRHIWTTLARRHRTTGEGGPRATEILISDLYAVANWLRADDQRIKPDEAVAPPRWRQAMGAAWQSITDKKITVRRERHTAEEQERIFENLYHGLVEQRVALLIELGAELRGGQVLRLRRSAVKLEPDTAGLAPYGQFVVEGFGKKGGTQVAMTRGQREGLDHALEGYLRDCEAAYQAEAIQDYYLFTPYRIRRGGAAPARNADDSKPMGRQQMLRAFHKLELVANVEVIPGRGWYGLRRLSADLANDVETDARVLNQMGGWAPGSTVREDTYQEIANLKVAAKGAIARDKMRARKVKQEPVTASVEAGE